MTWPFKDLWARGLTYDRFVDESREHRGLWAGVYRAAVVPAWAVDEAAGLGMRLRLVVLAEDWCGDAANTVPVIAKFAAEAGIELRVLRRDEHPEVMDRYLTGSSRSIPVVVVLTEDWLELGWWGPRPSGLQRYVVEQRAAGRPKDELYPVIRRWYAKDKGHTTLREVLAIMSSADAVRS